MGDAKGSDGVTLKDVILDHIQILKSSLVITNLLKLA